MRDSIEVLRAIGATIILLTIFVTSIYYLQIEEERLHTEELPTKKEPIKQARLVIIMPNEVHVNQEVPINIEIIDSNGSLIKTREDLIEISLLTQGIVWLE